MSAETKIYALYDRVAGIYLSLIPSNNVEVLKRDYKNVVNELGSKSPLRQNCDDYDLYELGSFDVETGDIVSEKHFVLHLSELKNNEIPIS